MIAFRVYGHPAPQGSAKGFVVNSKYTGRPRAVVTHDNPATRPWRALVADAARQAGVSLTAEVPVLVTLRFFLSRPPSLPAWRQQPRTRPDLDKLVRATLDALTGIVWYDDAQVVGLEARKSYTAPRQSPGLEVELEFLPEGPTRKGVRQHGQEEEGRQEAAARTTLPLVL